MSTQTLATDDSARPAATPRKGWTPLRGIALAVTVALILIGAVNLLSLLMSKTTTQQLSFPLSGQTLSINVNGGDITVTGGDVSEIEVTQRVHQGIVKPTYDATSDDSGLHLSADCPWYAAGTCGVDYDVVLPRDAVASLRSGSGDVRVRDLSGDVTVVASSGDVILDNIGGTVNVRSSSGDVDVTGAAGDVSVVVSSGDIDASGLESDRVAIRSSSGDTRVGFTGTPTDIQVTASSGVHVSVPDDGTAYAVEEHTSSGDGHVSVDTDSDSTHTATLRTSSGDLTFDYN